MHKSMAAYTYIYGKAVELLQHPVEKSKISIFNKNQRTILCMVLSAAHVIYLIYQFGMLVSRGGHMRLKALREKRGISQLKLAMDLGLNQNSISRYESGAREADYKTLIALADYFDVSIDYLLERTDKPKMNR